ncbi:MAG: hypothetical protein RR212_02705 [Bacteroidales bacterium]
MVHKNKTNLPVIYMEDLIDKHLEKIKVSDTQREMLKESMQEVWYEEFLGGTFIELPEGMVIHFNEERLDDKEQNILYRKLMEEECYENTETLERYAFGKVRSISLHELVDKIMPVYLAKLATLELRKNMAQA